jgi:riboflavin synthase
MFTGIIELVSKVMSVRPVVGGLLLRIELAELARQVKVGDSLSINGACLTVEQCNHSEAQFHISEQTLAKTALGSLRPGRLVNIETALKVNGSFGGHIVQGHIDGTAVVSRIDKKGDFADMRLAVSSGLLDEIVPRGAVAVDGVSLTVAAMNKEGFTVALIPMTLRETTLGKAKPGDVVNIENDIIAKIVKKQLEKILAGREALTVEKLKELGF